MKANWTGLKIVKTPEQTKAEFHASEVEREMIRRKEEAAYRLKVKNAAAKFAANRARALERAQREKPLTQKPFSILSNIKA